MNHRRPIQPLRLQPDSTIAIVAPAGIVDRSKLEASIAYLHQLGFKTKTYRDIYAKCDIFAGDDSARATELMSAFEDSEVQAIFAARGGYGCIRLLQKLDYNVIAAHPKIFLGYSDNTVLHAAFNKKCNLITYHGPHASDFRNSSGGMPASSEASLWQMLSGDGFEAWQGRLSPPIIAASRTPLDRQTGLSTIVTGAATGPIVGGNLALVCALVGTEYEVDTADKILFLEDVDEPPYRVDRLLQQLRLAGTFERVAGVVLGSFTRCGEPASNWPTHTVLEKFFQDAMFPTVSGFPAGHGSINFTFALGVEATINATAEQSEVLVAANQTLGGA